jgi:hypothetical protein
MCREYFKKERNSPSLQQILGSINFKCEKPECKKILTIENFHSHINKCLYNSIKCKNCDYAGNQADISAHNRYCNKSIKCQFCNNEYRENSIKQHEKICSSDPDYERILFFFDDIILDLKFIFIWLHCFLFSKLNLKILVLYFILLF